MAECRLVLLPGCLQEQQNAGRYVHRLLHRASLEFAVWNKKEKHRRQASGHMQRLLLSKGATRDCDLVLLSDESHQRNSKPIWVNNQTVVGHALGGKGSHAQTLPDCAKVLKQQLMQMGVGGSDCKQAC